MSAERGWIVSPRADPYSVEAWAQRHRRDGHHPHPAPTAENPERWECKCDPDTPWTAVWRILTVEQIGRKFAHLRGSREAAERARRRAAKLERDLRKAIRPPLGPPLRLAERYAAGRPRRVSRGV